jgi:hypothetical protein
MRPAQRLARAAGALGGVVALAAAGAAFSRESAPPPAPEPAASPAGDAAPGATGDAAGLTIPATRRAAVRAERRAARPTPVWISPAAIRARPTHGAAWKRLLEDARADPGRADVSDQNSNHDVATLAAALVCARTRDVRLCAKARAGVLDAIGTERGARWLAVGRNLTAYAIAADVMDLRAGRGHGSAGGRVEAWLRGFLTETLRDNNSHREVRLVPFDSGSNASGQEGAAYAAVAAYLRDPVALGRAWDGFLRFVCDPGAPHPERIDLHRGIEHDWAADPAHPCAINPAGSRKPVPAGRHGAGEVHRLDGAIVNDMSRGGDYQWPPGLTDYPWVGLEGLVPAAVILANAGFPAFRAGDRAILRAVDYLWQLRVETAHANWFTGSRSGEIIQLVDATYGRDYPHEDPVGAGRTVGYTDWTHPRGVRGRRR